MTDVENPVDLLDRLDKSWDADSAHALAMALSERINDPKHIVEPANTSRHTIRLQVHLSHIHLRGLSDQNPALIVSRQSGTADSVETFFRSCPAGGDIPLVFCLTAEAEAEARSRLPTRCAAVFPREQVIELLTAADARAAFTGHLLSEIGRRRLNPYNILHPVCGESFFGRKREVSQLLDDYDQSFAIAGPGQIGKSSLLRQYHWQLVRNNDPRASRLYLIDFYNLDKTDSNSIAEHIAFTIEQTKRNHDLKARELPSFLKRLAYKDRGRPEFLLDEVDRVCHSEVFDMLGHEAKVGNVRLIMAGKGQLMKLGREEPSSFKGRFKSIHLQPFDARAARDVITLPLDDLGIELKDRNSVVEHILCMSGRLPCLLQFYCQNIVDWAINNELDQIGMEEIEAMEARDFSLTVLGPLLEMPPLRQELALSLCRKERRGYSIPEIQALSESLGHAASLRAVSSACMDLVIQNILVVDRDHYRIANEALPRFAERAGLMHEKEVVAS